MSQPRYHCAILPICNSALRRKKKPALGPLKGNKRWLILAAFVATPGSILRWLRAINSYREPRNFTAYFDREVPGSGWKMVD